MELNLRYKEAFERIREIKDKTYVLRGDQVIVEVIEREVRSKGGLVIAQVTNQAHGHAKENEGLIGYVLDVGAGFYDEETGETVALDTKVGDIVLLPKYALSHYSTFPGIVEPTNNKVAMCKDSEIRLTFSGADALKAVTDAAGL